MLARTGQLGQAYSPPCLHINQTVSVHFLQAPCVWLLRLKIEDATGKFKDHRQFTFLLALSYHSTFNQTKTGAAVPLIKSLDLAEH
jgi:hypothetical protein